MPGPAEALNVVADPLSVTWMAVCPGANPACKMYWVGLFAEAPQVRVTDNPFTAAVRFVGDVGGAARNDKLPHVKTTASEMTRSFDPVRR